MQTMDANVLTTDELGELKEFRVPEDESGYLDYFGFSRNPFPVVPDDRHFYLSDDIDQIVSEILYGVKERKGFMVLTGDVGLGKTTISRKLIRIFEEKNVETALVFHTSYSDTELLREINRDFGLSVDPAGQQLGNLMAGLNKFLIDCNLRQKNCLIVIDDAQNLDSKTLELVRMISNLETDNSKLVQILLVGQPELMETLSRPELRQLKSRIIIHKEVQPLSFDDLRDYILFKLNACGGSGRATVKENALKRIQRITRGNFRRINILLDRCLCLAFLHNSTCITSGMVQEASHDITGDTAKPRCVVKLVQLAVVFIFFGAMGFCASAIDRGSAYALPQFQSLQTAAVAARAQARTPPMPAAVSAFLGAYDLTSYSVQFRNALLNNRLDEFCDTITAEQGLQLVCLAREPSRLREQYGVLSWPGKSDGRDNHYLFWKPTLTIESFYYGYQGDEIIKLQELLQKAGLYIYEPDGDVGNNLMKAVVQFQQQENLPLSGFPDREFIFRLCNRERTS
ncbi:MAG: AAA family ATPase [Deltaproteobacteria bacterium]|nr:AAA family ATPase [Deltaproteobacteria bacterium]